MTEEDLKYVENKHRGGYNNAKGNKYETFYAVYYILRYMNTCDANYIRCYSQVKYAFLDDFLISYKDKKIYHQIKNKKSISWGKEDTKGTIAYDFKKQMQECVSQNGKYALKLVTSHEYEKLVKTQPSSLANTSVEEFPFYESLNKYIYLEFFRNEILPIFGGHNDYNRLADVAMIVLGLWCSGDYEGETVAELRDLLYAKLGKIQISPTYDVELLIQHLEQMNFQIYRDGNLLEWSWNRLKGITDVTQLAIDSILCLTEPLEVISML